MAATTLNRKLMTWEPSNPGRGTWEDMDMSEQATAMAFNQTGSLLAVGGKLGRIALWDVTTLRTVIKVLDPMMMVTEDDDDMETSLDAEELKVVQSVKQVNRCAWSRDSTQLIVACLGRQKQGQLCIWNINKGIITKTISFESNIVGLALHPLDSSIAVVSCLDAESVLINLDTNEKKVLDIGAQMAEYISLKDAEGEAAAVSTGRSRSVHTTALYNKTGDRLFFCSTRGHLSIVDASTMKVIHAIAVIGGVRHPDIHLDRSEEHLIVPTLRGVRYLRVVEQDESKPFTTQHLFFVGSVKTSWSSCAFSGDNKYVIGVPTSQHIHVGEKCIHTWDFLNGEVAEAVENIKEGISSILSHPFQAYIVVITNLSNVLVLEHKYKSNWAGRMYPVGYVLIDDNVLYDEPEDEFDPKPEPVVQVISEEEPISVVEEETHQVIEHELGGLFSEPIVMVKSQDDEPQCSGSIFRPKKRDHLGKATSPTVRRLP